MKIELSRLWRSRGFRLTLLACLLLNAASWLRYQFSGTAAGPQASAGFPFPMHITDDFEGTANFYLLGLLLDVAVAVTLALLVTWLLELRKR